LLDFGALPKGKEERGTKNWTTQKHEEIAGKGSLDGKEGTGHSPRRRYESGARRKFSLEWSQ